MITLRYYNGSNGDGMDERWYSCADCGGGDSSTSDDGEYCNRMYPESNIVHYEGKTYCKAHYHWRFDHEQADAAPNPTFENERD